MNTLTDKLNQLLLSIDFILPEVWLAGLFFALILIDLFSKKEYLKYVFSTGLMVEIVLIYTTPTQADIFLASLSVTELSKIFKYVFAGIGIFTVFILHSGDKKEFPNPLTQVGEFYAILSVILLGMNILAMSENLLIIYLALEIVSIGGYILTVLHFDRKGLEVGIKYIIFGIFSSAVMLYGMSLLYGFSGSLDLDTIAQSTKTIPPFAFLTAFVLAIAGFLFKISASPFHIWTPDVYEGAPTSIVAFFSTASKSAGFAILIKFTLAFKDNVWVMNSLIVIATISILIGSFSALWQNSFKRLLAYSGIAQAGFILVGLLPMNLESITILIFYLIVYILANLIAFLSLVIIENGTKSTNSSDQITHFSGIGNEHLSLGLALSISMISLVGLPLTAGFTAKLLIFTQIWQIKENSFMLIIFVIGLLSTALSLYFYLKIPYFLFFRQKEHLTPIRLDLSQQIALSVLAFILLFLFIKPEFLLSLIHIL